MDLNRNLAVKTLGAPAWILLLETEQQNKENLRTFLVRLAFLKKEVDHCNNAWSQKDLKLCELSENTEGVMNNCMQKRFFWPMMESGKCYLINSTWEIVVKDYSSQHIIWKMKSVSELFCLGRFIQPSSVKNLRAYIN